MRPLVGNRCNIRPQGVVRGLVHMQLHIRVGVGSTRVGDTGREEDQVG
jgi:hypothetical protein